MAIEEREGQNKNAIVLVECPLCGKEFGDNCGHERTQHFVNDHSADDFGLTDP